MEAVTAAMIQLYRVEYDQIRSSNPRGYTIELYLWTIRQIHQILLI